MKTRWTRHLLLSFTFAAVLAGQGAFAASISRQDLGPVEKMPVQNGGRVKPLASFAREAVIFVTGKESFEGRDSIQLLFDWLAQPDVWEAKSLIPVSAKAVRELLGIPEARRASPKFLFSHAEFLARVERNQGRSEAGETLTFAEQKELELYQKMNLFYSLSQGKAWTVIPPQGDPEKNWHSLDEIASDGRLQKFREPLAEMIQSYREGDRSRFQRASEMWMRSLAWPQSFALELHYHRLRPFRWAWILYLASFLAFVLRNVLAAHAEFWHRLFRVTGLAGAALGFLLHTYGFLLRCLVAGRPPVSNMYESVVWVSWAVVLFSALLYVFSRSHELWAASTAVAAFGLILADSLPAALDPSLAPLVPVLRNNFWLTVHVLTITLSYGAFALALGIGHMSLLAHAFRPERDSLLQTLTRILYRSLQIGVVLLAAGTILGGVWANYSWGRFWGWDPKETWALIALLGYLALLHARFIGWLGPFGLAVGSIVAFLGILMAWYGVNFVLAAGLHSYGFGGGGLLYVVAFVLADLAAVAALMLRYRFCQGQVLSKPVPDRTGTVTKPLSGPPGPARESPDPQTRYGSPQGGRGRSG